MTELVLHIDIRILYINIMHILYELQLYIYICIYIYKYIDTTITDHHHTVQVARVQVQYLRQWLDEKAPPVQVAEGDTTTCASGLSALVAE